MLSVKDTYNHWAHCHRVLAEVLDDARDGKLATRWHDELRAYALGLPRLGGLGSRRPQTATRTGSAGDGPAALAADGCLLVRQGHAAAALAGIDDETVRLHPLYACAVLDVTRRQRSLWEPYVAQGYWRCALHEWYTDRIATHEQSRALDGAEALHHSGQQQALDAQQRDLIEAKYRAGMHAGSGSDDGRREWFIGRVEGWEPTDLRTTLRRRMMSGDNFSAWEKLPHSWTAASGCRTVCRLEWSERQLLGGPGDPAFVVHAGTQRDM